MSDALDVSYILTRYNISPDRFTDILFQHGVDKVYYYGSVAPREIDGFVSLISKTSETYGLPNNKKELYERNDSDPYGLMA